MLKYTFRNHMSIARCHRITFHNQKWSMHKNKSKSFTILKRKLWLKKLVIFYTRKRPAEKFVTHKSSNKWTMIFEKRVFLVRTHLNSTIATFFSIFLTKKSCDQKNKKKIYIGWNLYVACQSLISRLDALWDKKPLQMDLTKKNWIVYLS